MSAKRVALIYDDTSRPETTGGYCLRALGRFADVKHFRLADVDQLPPRGFDLYLNIDDGLRYRLPQALHPAAWWAIDTHLDLPWYLAKAPDFDFVFTAQRDGASKLREAGIQRAAWLPLACDPEIHGKHKLKKPLDICFIGNVWPATRRAELVRLLQREFPNSFVGQLYFEEMARSYSSSKLVFNQSIRNDINMRVFEALACGSLLLTNDLRENGQAELFQDGAHLATYTCAEELLDKARFYLRHDRARERIANAGRHEALASHTYHHRMQTILAAITESDSRPKMSVKLTIANPRFNVSRVAKARSDPDVDQNAKVSSGERRLRLLYVGVFSSPWTIERAAAESMRRLGHEVDTLDERVTDSHQDLIQRLEGGNYDCVVFSPGRVGPNSQSEFFFNPSENIARVIEAVKVPCYLWYFDRALGGEPSREKWMRRVAPLCRVAFVVDERLTRTDWATWYWLQQGFRVSDLGPPVPPDRPRRPVGFIGSIYGDRVRELAAVSNAFDLSVISDAFGPARHEAIHNHDIILGPRYPCVPGYWSDRIYVVLGHGGFFLAPEIEGMREEGFVADMHYAALGDDPVADIRYWLERPQDRQRIARAGQELVLSRFTYDHRASELCWVIIQTLGAAPASSRVAPTAARNAISSRSDERLTNTGPGLRPPAIGTDENATASLSPQQNDTTSTDAHHGQSDKEPYYYQWPRYDLLEMIPITARRVLDIGCGAGKLGELLKARQPADVVGIELDPDAAEAAAKRLNRVLVGDVEVIPLDFPESAFDCVICGDILEHLLDPKALLRRARRWLSEAGCLVASIPNVRHHSVVTALMEGNWTYQSAGLLDETHLQFFCRRDIERLFLASGYTAHLTGTSPFEDLEQWRKDPSAPVNLGPIRVEGPPPTDAEEFFVYQYLVHAIPRPRVDAGVECSSDGCAGQSPQAGAPLPSSAAPIAAELGCVLAIRNRPAEYLERTFQTFAYQTVKPADKLLLDWGSDELHQQSYQQLCLQYGWRLIRAEPVEPHWHLSAAYNLAIACLKPDITVVFKSDIDELLSPQVLQIAAKLGKEGFSQFNRYTTDERVRYPQQFQTGEDLWEIFEHCPRPDPSVSAGIAAFPRAWFEAIGGFDLRFAKWGYEDHDLRERAGSSIKVQDVDSREGLAIHQWHPPPPEARDAPEENLAYFAQVNRSGQIVRNGGSGLYGPVRRLIKSLDGGTGPQDVKSTTNPSAAEARPIVRESRPVASHALSEYGLTSIVIVTRNLPELTRFCLESIRERTSEPYELIVVDNGSNDSMLEYLRSQPDLRLIENGRNMGFPAAANEGIKVASGRQVLLLNNDTIVTQRWLTRLLRALHSSADVGLAGPCSNEVGGLQRVPMTYRDDPSLQAFAAGWVEAHLGRLTDTETLSGFCLLIRKDLIDLIGVLDERFGIGNFEDHDYCVRAAKAGYRAVVAWDAFVHHAGSRSFAAEGIDMDALMGANRQLFRDKWGAAAEPATAIAGNAHGAHRLRLRTSKQDGLVLGREPVRLSLCMIVRDSARTLPACLRSIRPWVDEMVIVDTGSTDNTPQISREFGARLFYFPWCDSFAAARNESVRHARGQWVFWMDSDDTIDAENGRRLRELAYNANNHSILGYVAQVHCPGDDAESDVTAVDHVKLFRNLPHLQFEGRIHEQILPSIRRACGEVAWTDLFVTHSGTDQSPEGRRRKQERDLHLLDLELRDKPEDSFTLFNIGMTYADMSEHEKAIEALDRSLSRADPSESHVRKIFALLVASHSHQGHYEKASEVCERGLIQFPEDPELLFRRGILAHQFGRFEEAEQAYLSVLRERGERHFTSVDRGITGFKARHNLAVVYWDMGRPDQAEALWRQVVQEVPKYRDAWRALGENLVQQGKLEVAELEADRLVKDDRLRGEGLMIKAMVAKARGDRAAARRLLEAAAAESPGLDALRALGAILFEDGDLRMAEETLRRIVRDEPEDASACCNLGTVYLRTGRPQSAIECYRESLRMRPNSPLARQLLEEALRSINSET